MHRPKLIRYTIFLVYNFTERSVKFKEVIFYVNCSITFQSHSTRQPVLEEET